MSLLLLQLLNKNQDHLLIQKWASLCVASIEDFRLCDGVQMLRRHLNFWKFAIYLCKYVKKNVRNFRLFDSDWNWSRDHNNCNVLCHRFFQNLRVLGNIASTTPGFFWTSRSEFQHAERSHSIVFVLQSVLLLLNKTSSLFLLFFNYKVY